MAGEFGSNPRETGSLPYHTKPYHTLANHTIPYQAIPYHIIPTRVKLAAAGQWPSPPLPHYMSCLWYPALATTGMCPRQMMLFHSLTNIKLSTGGGRKPPCVHIYCTTDKLLLQLREPYWPSHATQYDSFDLHNVLLSSSTQEMSLKIKISESLWCAVGMAHRQIVHE